MSEVAGFYDRYPYPPAGGFTAPNPRRYNRDRASLLLRRRARDWIPAHAKVWVIGCGTVQATHWGLCFPEGEILATDISPETLRRAEAIAKSAGCDNIRFAQEDLATSPHREEFDWIVCTGVIHHLPDPDAGFAGLRAALKPEGAALVMVYSTLLREPLVQFRGLFRAMGGDALPAEERYPLMRRLLEAQLDSPRAHPVGQEALAVLRDALDEKPAFVADALIHPQEVTFDLPTLFASLDKAGLAHRSWNHPRLWELGTYLDDETLGQRFSELPIREREHAVYHAGGYHGPQLECLVERVDRSEPPRYEPQELLALPFVFRTADDAWELEGTSVRSRGSHATYRLDGDAVEVRGGTTSGPPVTARIPADILPVLKALDGTRPLGEVLQDSSHDANQLLGLLVQLLPPELDLIAPSP